MSKFKFRAWDKKEKKMIYEGFCILQDGNVQRYHCHEEYNKRLQDLDVTADYAIFDFTDWYAIDNYEIMQYVWVKDKSGKEIYEGDICTDPDFSKKIFTIDDIRDIRAMQAINWEKVEVIGNIYENPELVNKHHGIL